MSKIRITSPTNSLVKDLVRLKNVDSIKQQRLFVMEGDRLVNDYLAFGRNEYKLRHLIVREDREQDFDADVVVSHAVFSKLSSTQNPQGVMAVAQLDECSLVPPCDSFVVLDNVSDPGNAGTILRTAAACGFSHAYFVDGAYPFSPKVVRASMGAIFFVKVIVANRQQVLELVRGKELLCACVEGENVFNTAFSSPCGIVVGNEACGVSEELVEASTKVVSLPMRNVESLNAAVAASVLMYEVAKRKLV